MKDVLKKVTIAYIDYLIIERVKTIRTKKGISRKQLSVGMKLSPSFVGKVEDLSQRDKYSIRHLPLLAKGLNLTSLSEILPDNIPSEDMVEITYIKVPKLGEDGAEKKQLEDKVISIKAVEKNK